MIWATGMVLAPSRNLPAAKFGGMDQKRIIHQYLDKHRTALLAKLDGADERAVRWPMTRTGTNLLGLVKHVAGIELGYFGDVFDRPSHIRLPWLDEGAETNADMWATAEESREEIVALYLRAAVHADATIEALTLGSPGRVPWWSPPERQQVTLQLIDGAAGDNNGELPDQTANQWATYRLQLQEAAAEAARRTEMGGPGQPRTS
jgi:hypothetical protein